MLDVRQQTMTKHIVMILVPRNDHLLSLHNIVSTVIQNTGLSIPQLSLVGNGQKSTEYIIKYSSQFKNYQTQSALLLRGFFFLQNSKDLVNHHTSTQHYAYATAALDRWKLEGANESDVFLTFHDCSSLGT